MNPWFINIHVADTEETIMLNLCAICYAKVHEDGAMVFHLNNGYVLRSRETAQEVYDLIDQSFASDSGLT